MFCILLFEASNLFASRSQSHLLCILAHYSLLRGWSDWHEMLSDDLNPLQQLLQQQQRTNNSGNDGVFTLEASSQHKPDGTLFYSA